MLADLWVWKLRGYHRCALAQGKGKQFVLFIWLRHIFGTVLGPATFLKSLLVVVVVPPISKFLVSQVSLSFIYLVEWGLALLLPLPTSHAVIQWDGMYGRLDI